MINNICNIIEPNSILEQLAYTTVLIESNGKRGTGFLIQKELPNKSIIPFLVTNKHVLYNEDTLCNEIKIKFRKATPEGKPSNELFEFSLGNFSKFCKPHSNPAVDLCAINMLSIINSLQEKNIFLFIKCIPTDIIPSDEILKELDYMEDIFMVGYPRGLSDELNNYPIFRRGVTATHPYVDYQGKREFLADITCIGGSSGSPVFLKKEFNVDKHQNISIGSPKFYFMGICYFTELTNTYTSDKEDKKKAIPTDKIYTTMNIAHIIKSSEIYELIK